MKLNKINVGALFLMSTCSVYYAQEVKTDSLKKETQLEGVIIRGNVKKSDESNIISLQKKSVEVVERVGAEQLSKQGVGDVSIAVTKATGAQKQEGSGQVFIRGLGDRNNATTLNGLPIPANDPLFKNIDLSIIKTDMIDVIGLEKVYAPRMWGDMSGANVDIISKVYTGKPYFEINLGSSINLNTIKEKNFYLQDGPNYFGFKQINKPSNANLVNLGYVFTTKWEDQEVLNPINSSLGVNFGRTFRFENDSRLSLFGFGSFSNDYLYNEGIVRSVDNVGNPLKDLSGKEYNYNTNTTGLLNLNYKLNSQHTFNFTTNYIHTTDQKVGNYNGYLRDINEDRAVETAYLRRSLFRTNDLFINQLRGEHKVSEPLKITWNVGYNRLDSRRPDRQQNISVYNSVANAHRFASSNPGANHRYFDKLVENDYVGDIHADYVLSENAKVTLGYNGRYKDSDFRATQYNFRVLASQGSYYVDPRDYGSFFNIDNYQSGSFFDIVTFRGSVNFNPDNALIPQFYTSEILNNAGYLNIEYKFNENLTGQLGVRYDNLDQKINYNTAIFSNGGDVDKKYSKILPALNLKYALNDNSNLRFSASKTYTTPLLLEVAPYEYEEIDELSFGNIDVNPSDNYNFDLKWEWFPKRGEVISLTGFGKYISDPISRVTVNSSSNSVSFVNVGDTGTVYGVEMELRKDLYDNGNTKFYTFLNGTYLNTKQDLDAQKVIDENPNSRVSVSFIKNSDKMQGASEFLANVNLGMEQKWNRNAMNFVLSYSHISDNIYALGYDSKGNQVDKAINMLDAVLKFDFNNGLGLSFSGKNLLDPSFKRVQENVNGDVAVRDYKRGINLGVGVSYKF